MRRGAPQRRPVGAQTSGAEASPVRAWVRILAIHKRGLHTIKHDLEREITLPRFDLLANLVREDGQTLASLSRSMLVTAGNLTGLVDRAARDGLVERRADPDDRRAWRVHILSKGLTAFREAERRHAAKVAKVFSGLSADELRTLILLLDKVKDALREPPVTGKPPRPQRPRARAAKRPVKNPLKAGA